MSFKPTVGAQGVTHPSEAEALLSFPLFALGIVSHEAFYPEPFVDGEGELFRAKSDFRDSFLPDISYETKSGSLNGKKSCATAAKALANVHQQYAAGWIKEDDYDYRKLDASWSASVPKFKFVQYQTAEAGRIVVMVYDKKPPPDTLKRLDSAKVFWVVHGDEYWKAFLSFRTLAKHGFRSAFTIKGHGFTSHGGLLLH
ncbi:MAG: hypothetical protein Q7K57_37470 [Burkholderiaceae bacterium]|nr:hypothetical protein [Burkholderiaceae bacterium]